MFISPKKTPSYLLKNYALSMLFGLLLSLAFAPYYFYLMAIICPAALYVLSQNALPRQALRIGFAFGLGFFGFGVYWIYISLHTYGNIPIIFASIMTALFISFLALFPATQCYILNHFFNEGKTKLFFAFPSLWVLSEWSRAHLFSGFPWLLLGYSQTQSNLRGFLPIIGTYGLSYLLVFLSALLIFFLKEKKIKIIPFLIFPVLLWLIGGWSLNYSWTHPIGKPTSVALVQGNIDQSIKWSDTFYLKTQEIYQKLTEKNWTNRLIVWPENAITLPLPQSQFFLDTLDASAKANHATLITGLPILANNENTYFNAAISLGTGRGEYAKQQLVPFGESDPSPKFLSFIKQWFNLPEGEILPGNKKQGNLVGAGLLINPTICYEVAYSKIIRQFAGSSHLLMTISNDAWFGHSSAAWQHVQIVQTRALETGRYAITAANTGVTAIINNKGQILKQAPVFKETVLKGYVQALSGITPWLRLGDWPAILLACLIFSLALLKNQYD